MPLSPFAGLTPKQLEEEIVRRTEAIWLTEPKDLTRLCAGVVDSGAGTRGNYFTTLLFAQSEVRGIAYNACSEVLALSEDSLFGLDLLKKIAKTLFTGRAGFLNYIGMHEFGEIFQAYLAVIDPIEERELFVSLTAALRTYGVRVHLWTEQCFPWDLGAHFIQVTPTYAERLLAEVQKGPWERVPYLIS